MRLSAISALAAALALGLVAPVQAEDWTGLHVSFGLSRADTDVVRYSSPVTDRQVSPYIAAGYDWAIGDVTFGVLADINLGGSSDADLVAFGKGFSGEADWFATLRGRAGIPLGDKMRGYASGGIAIMRADAAEGSFLSPGVTYEAQSLSGTVLGLGAEFALTGIGHVSMEVIRADFEESAPFGTSEWTLDPDVTALRLGYTWRF